MDMCTGQRLVSLSLEVIAAKFADAIGEEYQAVVEYSPIQRTPLSAKVKVDGRQGTIEEGMYIATIVSWSLISRLRLSVLPRKSKDAPRKGSHRSIE
jgi:hypothetical protein